MNDELRNPRETERQLEENAAEWAAWLEWQKICSVLCCSKGNRNILSRVVFKAFKRKLATASRVLHDQWASDGTLSARRDDFIQEFDVGIEIKAREGELARVRAARGEGPRREETLTTSSPNSDKKVVVSPKDYKKHAFNLALQQPDDPLRAIRGQLTGPLGIINAIVEHYLLYTCGLSLDWITDPKTGKRSIGFIATSFSALEEKGIGNPDAGEDEDSPASAGAGHLAGFGDLEGDFNPENGDDAPAADNRDPLESYVSPEEAKVDEEELSRLRGEIRQLYDVRQMAVLLAGLRGMPINSTALQEFCGLRHSALAKKFHALFTTARDPESGQKTITDVPGLSKLRDVHLGKLNFRSGPVVKEILDTFRDVVGRAPGGRAFLSALPEKRQRKEDDPIPLAPARPRG